MSDMPWLRLYTDTVDNEKLRLLAFEDRWHYIALLCLKQQGILDSNNDLMERKIAVKLGVQLRELDEIKRRLSEVDLIDNNFQPIGWDKHQYKSDSSTARVRKYRENKQKKECNVTETLQERNSNAVDKDTDTDTEKEFVCFWNNYPRKDDKKKARIAFNRLTKKNKQLATKDCATRYLETEKRFIPLATTYIHGERWNDGKEENTNYGAGAI